MVSLGFHQTFINCMIECVTTPSYSLLVNISPLEPSMVDRGHGVLLQTSWAGANCPSVIVGVHSLGGDNFLSSG